MAPIIICVDGNIGAGKSTLLNEMAKRRYTVFREQVEGRVDRHDWLWALDNAYSDPKRWACTLQLAVLKSMALQKRCLDKLDGVVLVERSPVSTAVFTNVWRNRGCLTDEEFQLVSDMTSLIGWAPSMTVMLTTSPEECFDRMNRRGRRCEDGIQLSHLLMVDDEYKSVYSDKNVMHLDHVGDPKDVADRFEKLIACIL